MLLRMAQRFALQHPLEFLEDGVLMFDFLEHGIILYPAGCHGVVNRLTSSLNALILLDCWWSWAI